MTLLKNLDILILDCQATGARPDRDHLLEMGWAATRAARPNSEPADPNSTYCLKMPAGISVPARIARMTGISADETSNGLEAMDVWRQLRTAAAQLAAAGRPCPTVIHFARFERPFLEHLHRHHGPGDRFPFDIICTHDIARRLFAELPRRGLRALAGFLGHSVPTARRSRHHVAATAHIWRQLVPRLEADHGVRTWRQLHEWLARAPIPSQRTRRYPMSRTRRLELADRPGVYRFVRSNGDLLYVGKARSLRQRVNSYFQKRSQHAEHTLEMLTQAAEVSVTATPTALEAAVMETDEIKAATPPYNIALQAGDRRVLFCTRDLASVAHRADADHRIGPLVSDTLVSNFGALAGILAANNDEAGAGRLLNTLDSHVPDKDTLLAGLALFRQRHRLAPGRYAAVRGLLPLGARLWRQRQEADDALGSAPAAETRGEMVVDPEQSATAIDLSWDPESAAAMLESIVRRGAHLIRRSRWFGLLAVSALAWECCSASLDRPRKRLLVFAGGRIVSRSDVPVAATLPAPPDSGGPLWKRQPGFDLATYDRLRVVTTELRRLVAAGRRVELNPGFGRVLRTDSLQRLLGWV